MSYKKVAYEGGDLVANVIFATMDVVCEIVRYIFLFPFWILGLCKRFIVRVF